MGALGGEKVVGGGREGGVNIIFTLTLHPNLHLNHTPLSQPSP